ncbi:hypothetical protein PROFUN_03183 [Planoprotostelium fungivorum]|uniref:Endonuclease n=1 Tax=Planoprotostelium fungivorum TaxID=1890364 RepID=A0A2P6NX05_9EUKA|nr:hypothetical protein PROFUN_03183 [Planoprotostelium fungivorum]
MRAILFVCFIASAVAWGSMGHRIVAAVAEARLSSASRQYVTQLLKAVDEYDDLLDLAPLADQYSNSGSGDWTSECHYVNVPRGTTAFKDQFCNDDCCVVGAIRNYTNLMARTVRNPVPCKFGKGDEPCPLAFLTHYIADVHQPLHVAYKDDHGGNSVQVSFFGASRDHFGEPYNLHSVWDNAMMYQWNSNMGAAIKNLTMWIISNPKLVFEFEKTSDPSEWATESLKITNTRVYAQDFSANHDIGVGYYNANIGIVIQRLVAAGLRLAKTINRITGGQ